MWRISVLEVSHSGQHIEGLCSRILSLLYNFFHNSRKVVFSHALFVTSPSLFPCNQIAKSDTANTLKNQPQEF